MAKHYKIHPSIGIARVGTSPETFLGPEIPGLFAIGSGGKYRDSSGRLKRQAARYRVYEYDDTAGTVTEINPGSNGIARIVWTVELKNKKAVWFEFRGIVGEGAGGYPSGHPLRNAHITTNREQQLVINPGARTLTANGTPASAEVSRGTSSTPANETWPGPLNGGAASIDSLGTISVDADGRLSVAGGYGVSGTTGALPPGGALNFDNNDDWFDDVSDGPVTARIEFQAAGQAPINAAPAWVTVAPPDFAPPVQNVVTVHDVLFDVGVRFLNTMPALFSGGAFQTSFMPSFTEHIAPVLQRALNYRWVIHEAAQHLTGGQFNLATLAALPAAGETSTTNPRLKIFSRLRNPDALNVGGLKTMPRLHNDGVDGAAPQTKKFSLTRFQYFAFQQWSNGDFVADWAGPPPPPAVTSAGLDRAALEGGAGGAFFPGMEMGWILRDPNIYVTPFEYRFRSLSSEGPTGLTAGDATKRMALPWQADFLKCGQNWWPAQRPNQVFVGGASQEWDRNVNSHVHLTQVWSQLGIVAIDASNPTQLIETERTLP